LNMHVRGPCNTRDGYTLFEQIRVMGISHRFISMIRKIDAPPFVMKG
jgi:hypothetical protein